MVNKMDKREQIIVRTYLRNRGLGASEYPSFRTLYSSTRMREILERGRALYPVEFAERVELYLDAKFLKGISAETQRSIEEELERGCIFTYSVLSVDEKLAKLKMRDLFSFQKTEDLVGRIERSESGIDVESVRRYCESLSTQERTYSWLHTHISGDNVPSHFDGNAHMLGRLELVSVIRDGVLNLTPYRGDSRSYADGMSFKPQENLELIVTDNEVVIQTGKGILQIPAFDAGAAAV